ncbi:hypothetical protein MMC28_006903 [Mycoblastus sanguinarius]|nr:hypothetical protein [Mycoblastus sanguinarius]
MPKKRTRYSSSLAADWVVPSPAKAEGITTEETSARRHPIQASGKTQSNRATIFNQDSRPIERQSEAENAKKRGRYKKTLPSGWVASESEGSQEAGSPRLLPMRDSLTSQPQDFELRDKGFGMRPVQQSMKRSTSPAHNIHTSLSPQNDSELIPPPAPTKARQMVISSQRPPAPPVFHQNSSLNRRSRSGQRSHVGLRPFQSLRDATVSPPISVGQSSSALTNSTSYGRDQPAIAPSISPSYSDYVRGPTM